MPILKDPEFGSITLRRSRLARSIRLRITNGGMISVSLPLRTPLFIVKQFLNESRSNIRRVLTDTTTKKPEYKAGDIIGKSHTLQFASATTYGHYIEQTRLVVHHPPEIHTDLLQAEIQKGILKALRLQAKSYLPRRLTQLALQGNFTYTKLRFSSAGTRWGSCSSNGTISLNIWLMQLPYELIDYVILHELCHTKHMNHSAAFWGLVNEYCPEYKVYRQQLKQYHPK